MTRLLIATTALAAILSIAACDNIPGVTVSSSTTVTEKSAPLTASAPPIALTETPATDDRAQSAASVVRVDPVADGEAKLFGTAGGDPAMNGLQTWIAFPSSPAGGWTLYSIGDVLDYTVLSSSTGRVDLELKESTMDAASGEIGSATRKVIVSWTPVEEAPPTGVTLAPAS